MVVKVSNKGASDMGNRAVMDWQYAELLVADVSDVLDFVVDNYNDDFDIDVSATTEGVVAVAFYGDDKPQFTWFEDSETLSEAMAIARLPQIAVPSAAV